MKTVPTLTSPLSNHPTPVIGVELSGPKSRMLRRGPITTYDLTTSGSLWAARFSFTESEIQAAVGRVTGLKKNPMPIGTGLAAAVIAKNGRAYCRLESLGGTWSAVFTENAMDVAHERATRIVPQPGSCSTSWRDLLKWPVVNDGERASA